jgi:type III secretion protein J
MKPKAARFSVITLSFFLTAGCAVRIQHGLDERQANEIQTVLVERGFEAKKVMEPGKKPTWSIDVDEDQAADAVRVVSELGLPRPRAEGFGEVFGKGSLVPTATEERALYIEALCGELARTLESFEGVTSARIHLVLPPPPRPGQPGPPAKAAAFLRVRPGEADRVNQQRAELRALIAGSVEGLTPDAVTLVVNEVTTQVHSPLHTSSPAVRLRVLVMVLGGTLSVLAALLVFLTLRLRHYRARAATPATPVTPAKPVVHTPAKRAA